MKKYREESQKIFFLSSPSIVPPSPWPVGGEKDTTILCVAGQSPTMPRLAEQSTGMPRLAKQSTGISIPARSSPSLGESIHQD
jgi:hypothetical protein